MALAECLNLVGGFYNMILVIIVIVLFISFLRKGSNRIIYMKPWKLLFFAICVYVIEEISQLLLNVFGVPIPKILFPIYEMIMITTFIYMLLMQKEYMKTGKMRKW